MEAILASVVDVATDIWTADYMKKYNYRGGDGRGSGGSRKCIFKWPQDLVQYLGEGIPRVPQMVAIGPYHHGQMNLEPMEDEKRKALNRVLYLSGGLEQSKFVDALKQVEQELRDHYDDLDPRWSSDSFIEMMLLDGCFLLDFLFKFDEYVEGALAESKRRELLYTSGSAVLNRDIHLLENQIPGLVLEVLMNVAGGSQNPLSGGKLSSQALHLLNLQRMNLLAEKLFPAPPSSDFLALVRRARRAVKRMFCCLAVSELCCCGVANGCWQFENENEFSQRPFQHTEDRQQKTIHLKDVAIEEKLQDAALETLWILRRRNKYLRSAKKLATSGVTFKKGLPDLGVWGVRFDKGVLYLPELVLNETSEGVLMNMVAFERMHPWSGTGITSFMSFMDALIDTGEDVSILGEAGIVTNNLGSDQVAAKIFNKLGMVQMGSPFDEVMEKVVTYASAPHHGWWAHFKDTHFANPWTILSLIGALLLLFLTIVQTVYTVLSFHHSNG